MSKASGSEPEHQDVTPNHSRDDEATKPYLLSNLPVDLPCDTPSYLVHAEEAQDGPRKLGVVALLTKTEVVWDYMKVLFTIFLGLLSMYAAAFRTIEDGPKTSPFLTLFAMGYPLGMMLLLLTRANEISLRKEMYYLLLKYKFLMDWNNWSWFGNTPLKVWRHSFFFWFWLVTGVIMTVYAAVHSNAYAEGCNSKVSFVVVLVVLLQVLGLFTYFYSTLTVEQSSLITLNRFLENKEGKLDPSGVYEFLDAGPLGTEALLIIEEDDIKEWAIRRFSTLPWTIDWSRIKPRTKTPEYKAELAEWQAAAQGDLQALRAGASPWDSEEDDVSFLSRWVYKRIYGYCLLMALRWHPDFEAMHQPLSWLLQINYIKLFASIATCIMMETYAIYLLFSMIASAA